MAIIDNLITNALHLRGEESTEQTIVEINRFFETCEGIIRLFIASSDNTGHQTNGINILRSLIYTYNRGGIKQIELLYEPGKENKNKNIIFELLHPCWDGNASYIILNNVTVSFHSITLGNANESINPSVSALGKRKFGMTGGYDNSAVNLAYRLNVSFFLILQPLQWPPLNALWQFPKAGDERGKNTSAYLKRMFYAQNQSEKAQKETQYVSFATKLACRIEKITELTDEQIYSLLGEQEAKANIISTVCNKVKQHKMHMLPAYGITNLNALSSDCQPCDILFHAVLGILHSQLINPTVTNLLPTVLFVMHNETYQNDKEPVKESRIAEFNAIKQTFLNQKTVWTDVPAEIFENLRNNTEAHTIASFAEKLDNLDVPNKIYLVFIERLPQAIFNYLYAIADLPCILEGKGTMTTVLNYGKPYFVLNPDHANQTEKPFHIDLVNARKVISKKIVEYYPVLGGIGDLANVFFSCSKNLQVKFEISDAYHQQLAINLPMLGAYFTNVLNPNSVECHYFQLLGDTYNDVNNDKLLVGLALAAYYISLTPPTPALAPKLNKLNALTERQSTNLTNNLQKCLTDDPLSDLYDTMLAHIENQTLRLFPDCISQETIVNAYCSLLGMESVGIENVSVVKQSEKEHKITVTGNIHAYGFLLNANLDFQVSNDVIETSSEFIFPSASDIFPDLGLFTFQDFKICIACSSLFYSETIWIGGTVSFGEKLALGIGFDYPTVQNQIVISGSFTEHKLAINSLFQFFGGVNPTDSLPSPLRSITEVGIDQINIVYDYKNSSILKSDITVSLDADWQLLPKLKFQKLILFFFVQSPMKSSRSFHAILTGEFALGKEEDSGVLSASLSLPDTTVSVKLQEGQVKLGDIVTLFMEQSIDLYAYLSDFSMEINCSDHSFKLQAGIEADKWEIKFTDNFALALTNLSLHIEESGGKTGGGIGGTMHIGPKTSGIDLTVKAEFPAEQKGFLFQASTGENQWIDLLDLAETFLKAIGGADSVPDWVNESKLQIGNLKFTASTIDEQKTYEASGSVVWNLTYHSVSFAKLNADICLGHKNSGTYGYIKGDATLLGMDVSAGYEFSKTDKSLFIEWLGMRGSYETSETEDQVKFTIKNKTLGDIISSLIQIFNASFKLAPPWDFLNAIKLDGLSITYHLHSKEIEVTYGSKIDLAFLCFDSITLLKNEDGVFLKASGTFLGLPIEDGDSGLGEGRDIQDLPQVPGQGNEIFKLDYLGLGQHVALYPTTDLNNMEDALDALRCCFKDPAPVKAKEAPLLPIPVKPEQPPTQPILICSKDSNWMIGARFTILNTVELGIIFNDPALYGLLIQISGEKLKTFDGLKFQILYKKISDSIGVYQMELQLPDRMRHLEFGAVSVTLPIINLDIYTNGNFKINFGFPKNLDFSKSFTIQAFPFTGSGGFYFALLNGETSKKVPQTSCGSFHPVIEFGMGLSLGIGKDVSAGILKAGLSLTLVGLLEGVLGFYHPTRSDYPGKDEVYYNISGTLGITGKIYGEINFAIIYARVDITFYAFIQITIESYNSIPIYVEAGVSMNLTVKINLGLFKIKVSLSFSTKISASFTIGKDERALAPWNFKTIRTKCALPALPNFSLIFQPIIADDNKKTIRLYFMPHLTLTQKNDAAFAAYAATLYIEQEQAKELVKAVLLWCVNACVNTGKTNTSLEDALCSVVTREQLQYIDEQMTNSDVLLKYHAADNKDIHSFIYNYFTVELAEPEEENELQASIFPMFPDFKLLIAYNENETTIDFGNDSRCSEAYMKQAQKLLREMSVEVEQPEKVMRKAKYSEEQCVSMSELAFSDYISIIARNAIHTILKKCAQTQSASELLGLLTDDEINQILGMTARFMLNGLSLPSMSESNKQNDIPLYELTKQLVTLPSLEIDDRYEMTLFSEKQEENLIFISKNKQNATSLQLKLDNHEISRIANINTLTWAPTLLQNPQPAPLYQDMPRLYSLGKNVQWSQPIYILPSPLQKTLKLHEKAAMTLHSSEQEENIEFTEAVLLDIEIRLTDRLKNTVYEIIGTEEQGIETLQKLLTYSKTCGSDFIKQLYFLYKENATDSRYCSQDPKTLQAAIIKTNLSTETNPINRMLRANNAIINPAEEFLQQLWEASLVRSGGFYLYYCAPTSLPDSLFDEYGVGSVKLLIDCESDVKTFINCIMPATDTIKDKSPVKQENLYILLPEITERRAIIAQGCGGLTLTRKYPGEYAPIEPYPIPSNEQSNAQDQIYLENQFHLLGCHIVGDQNFTETAALAATAPIEREDASADWTYDFVIPLSKHSKCGNADNPYSGVGKTAKIHLEWKDLFGCKTANAAPSYLVDIPLYYTDSLIAFSKWTGAAIDYYFTAKEKKMICFQFHYDPSRYCGGTSIEEWRQNLNYAQIDSTLYQKIYWQLEQNDVKISIYNSLYMDGQNDADLKADKQFFLTFVSLIQSYLANCCLYLESKLNGTPNPQYFHNMEQCLENINAASMFACEIEENNDSDLFELTSEIVVSRTQFVHPDFSEADGVASISNIIPPRADKKAGNAQRTRDTQETYESQGYSYQAFAENFEQLFQTEDGMFFKLGVGISDQGNQQLWAVRFHEKKDGKGISCNISDQIYYFAAKPLSTTLVNLNNIDISSYESGKPFSLDERTTKRSFYNIDLDAWAKTALEAVEYILSPDLSVPLYLCDNGALLKKICADKKTIAECIASAMTSILQEQKIDDDCLTSVKEKMKQRLLISLTDAYSISAVCAAVESGQSEQKEDYPIKLYGCIQKEKDSFMASSKFSNAKVPAQSGKTWLTSLFESSEEIYGKSAHFENLQYNITHIEYNIKKLFADSSYLASNWLSFILPYRLQKEIGEIDIPLPIRAYPAAPSVLSQTYAAHSDIAYQKALSIEKAISDDATPKDAQLAQMRQYDYNIVYQPAQAAQDTIKLLLYFNSDDQDNNLALNGKMDLPTALAQFIAVYPDIKNDLNKYLAGNKTPNQTAINAAQAFSTILSAVADAWQKEKKQKTNALTQESHQFDISEFSEEQGNIKSRLIVEVANSSNSFLTPIFYIEGFETEHASIDNAYCFYKIENEEKCYLTYEDSLKIKERTICIPNLDILQRQNAWAGIYVSRNEELLENRKTNPDFIYQTNLIKFGSKLVPLLRSKKEINIAALEQTEEKKSLETHLKTFFAALLENADSAAFSLKISCSYSYSLYKNAEPLTLPMFLTAPVPIYINQTLNNSNELIENLTSKINAWFEQTQPLTENGKLCFQVELYADAGSHTPFLALENVILKTEDFM